MKNILILLVLLLFSCSKNVGIREMCVDRTKEKLNEHGIQILSVDTIISLKPVNTNDSVICVVCKINKEDYTGYYVTESFISEDTIKQFKLLSSGTKEHCISYAKHGFYGKTN